MMWPTGEYNFSPSGYNSANNSSTSFFTNSFSDNEIKMSDSNFSHFQQQLAMSLTGSFPFISPSIPTSPNSTDTSHVRVKKRPNPVPPEKKTHAYYERRKKNNQSAQKSRNERRRREQENLLRIGQLEQENTMLRNMLQQLHSRVNFQELQLQGLQSQARPPAVPTVTTNTSSSAMERRQTSAASGCNVGQAPFAQQMNMLINY